MSGEDSVSTTKGECGSWRKKLKCAATILLVTISLFLFEKIDLFGVSGATVFHSEKIFYQVYSTFFHDTDSDEPHKETVYPAVSPDGRTGAVKPPIRVEDIAVVLMTESGIGLRGEWPPSFTYHKRYLNRIAAHKPRAIFIDVVFRQGGGSRRDRKNSREEARRFGEYIKQLSERGINIYLAATDVRPLARLPLGWCGGFLDKGRKFAQHTDLLVPPVSKAFLAGLMGVETEPDQPGLLDRYLLGEFPEWVELVSVQGAGFYRRGIEYQATDFWNRRRAAAVALYQDAIATGRKNKRTVGLGTQDCDAPRPEEATFHVAWATRDLSDLNWPWDIPRADVKGHLKTKENPAIELNSPQYYACRGTADTAGEALSANFVMRFGQLVWLYVSEAMRHVFWQEDPPKPDRAPTWVSISADVLSRQTCPPHLTIPDYDLVQVGTKSFEDAADGSGKSDNLFLKDRFIFYGSAVQLASDLIEPPTHTPLPGVYFHAMAFETLLRSKGQPIGFDSNPFLSDLVFLSGLVTILLVSVAFDCWRISRLKAERSCPDVGDGRNFCALFGWLAGIVAPVVCIAVAAFSIGDELQKLSWQSDLVFAGGLILILLTSVALHSLRKPWRMADSRGPAMSRCNEVCISFLWLAGIVVCSLAIATAALFVGVEYLRLPPTNFLGLFGLLLLRYVPDLRDFFRWAIDGVFRSKAATSAAPSRAVDCAIGCELSSPSSEPPQSSTTREKE